MKLRIREDVALGMLSTALKDLAVELDVFMRSATQVNGDLQEIKGIRDQRCIRGAKAIADKIDCGMVTAKVIPQELLTLGTSTYLEVLTAQQSLLAAQMSQLSCEHTKTQAVINLYQALGGGR